MTYPRNAHRMLSPAGNLVIVSKARVPGIMTPKHPLSQDRKETSAMTSKSNATVTVGTPFVRQPTVRRPLVRRPRVRRPNVRKPVVRQYARYYR